MKVKESGKYRISFAKWLTEKHPEVRLHDWQIDVLNILLNQPRAAGKTLLIKILDEYDQTAS
jgi:hypothetical protein